MAVVILHQVDIASSRRHLKISGGFGIDTISGAPEWHGRGGRNVNILPHTGQFHMKNHLAQMPIICLRKHCSDYVCFLEFSLCLFFCLFFPNISNSWFSGATPFQGKRLAEAAAVVSHWWDSKHLTTWVPTLVYFLQILMSLAVG